MGRIALQPSTAIARLLRDERKRRGWTLRDVEKQTRSLGRPIPFATLAKVEQGKVDPGIRRFHALFKIYDLPLELADQALDIEAFTSEPPAETPVASLYEDAIRSWKSGDLRRGLSNLAALRRRTSEDTADRIAQQKAILHIAIAVGSLGRYRLSRHLVEELLLTPPVPELLVQVLLQAAVCWHRLGSGEVALGFLVRAEANASPDDHHKTAWIAHERASTLASMGRLEEASSALFTALVEYRESKDAYGESQALAVGIRLLFARDDFEAASSAAREAREHAERHGFHRLVALRALDEGRALLQLGNREAGLAALSEGLSRAVAAQDQVAQFYAHYYLWKAYARAGDRARADMELEVARYFIRFLDAAEPEVREIRDLAPTSRKGRNG